MSSPSSILKYLTCRLGLDVDEEDEAPAEAPVEEIATEGAAASSAMEEID